MFLKRGPSGKPLSLFSNAILRQLNPGTLASQRYVFTGNFQMMGHFPRRFAPATAAVRRPAMGPQSLFVIGVACGIGAYSLLEAQSKIDNDSEARLRGATFRDAHLLTNKNHLAPDPDAATYEIGLFISSQRELEQQNEAHKRRKLQGALGVLYRIRFWLTDYVWENLITVGRFLEISLIFLPVVAVYPISWFGRRTSQYKDERYGSVLWYRMLRHAIELAGASFIKLGQWAASRTDIFPTALCEEFSHLHSNAKAHSLAQTKTIICKTFGIDSFEDIFESFDTTPLGVGAIAQVYAAKLNKSIIKDAPTGWVAIKVLHPNVEIKIERDLKIMKFFANLIDCIPTMEWLSFPQEVEQFSLLMRLQLDLRIEGANLQKFAENFKAKDYITFPSPFLQLTGREVLVEEFIDGISISNFLKLSNSNEKNALLKEISNRVLDSFLQMLILDNFIHADLHPGNIMIKFYKSDTDEENQELIASLKKIKGDDSKLNDELLRLHEEGYHAKICYIDTGLVTELNEEDRVNFIELFNALSEFDGYRAGELMIERSRTPETVISNEIFALKVERLVDRIKQRTFTLGNLSIGDLLDQVLGMVRQHHVRMEGDFITVIVAILLLEGIGRQLDPNLDLFASALPVLRKLGLQDGKYILKSEDSLSMIKVWMALEIRQFIHASIQDIHLLVKSDGLCPNY